MNSSYLNAAAGAFLGVVFVLMTISITSEGIFHTEAPEKPGFTIVAAEGDAGGEAGGSAAPEALAPIAPLMASADAANGEKVFKKCAACHSVDAAGTNKVGPGLYGVVGRPIAAHEGFNYSAAMKEHAAEDKTWTYEHLNEFIHKPKQAVPGTAMGFAGLPKDQDRADLLAYLREQAASPEPLPDPNAAPAADAAAAPAEAAPAADTAAPAASGDAAPATEAPAAPAANDNAAPASETPAAPAAGSTNGG